jgi:hypothetical protein
MFVQDQKEIQNPAYHVEKLHFSSFYRLWGNRKFILPVYVNRISKTKLNVHCLTANFVYSCFCWESCGDFHSSAIFLAWMIHSASAIPSRNTFNVPFSPTNILHVCKTATFTDCNVLLTLSI